MVACVGHHRPRTAITYAGAVDVAIRRFNVERVIRSVLSLEWLDSERVSTGFPTFEGKPGAARTLLGRTPDGIRSCEETISAMAATTDTPVLDTLAAMTLDSIERCGLAPDTMVIARIAALVAVDAPPVSYLAHLDPAVVSGVTSDQVQDVLVAIAPIVGSARVASAASHIGKALGFAIAVSDMDNSPGA